MHEDTMDTKFITMKHTNIFILVQWSHHFKYSYIRREIHLNLEDWSAMLYSMLVIKKKHGKFLKYQINTVLLESHSSVDIDVIASYVLWLQCDLNIIEKTVYGM